MNNVYEATKKPFQKKEYRAWNMDEADLLVLKDRETNKETFGNQLVINKESNKESIGNQLVTNKESNKESIGNQLVTNKEAKKTISKQISTNAYSSKANKKTISKPIGEHKSPSISKPLVSEESILETIKRLMGLQKKILFYITQDCISRGDLTSSYITNETLRTVTNTDAHTVKTSVQRLKKKNLLSRNKGKRGNGGFSSFTITLETRNAVIEEMRQLSISNQLVSGNSKQFVNYRETYKETSLPSSSSFLKELKETTTTTEMEELKASQSTLSEEWLSIDTEPLRPINFGKPQLSQLAQQGKLTAEMVQDSIFAFAFDLNVNNKAKEIRTTPLNYLMGTLNKGIVYTCSNYESPQDKAMREYKEQKERALKKQQEMEEEIFNLEFESWMLSFSEEAILELIPVDIKQNDSFRKYGLESGYARSALKEHFKKTVWTTVKNEVFPKIKYAASIDVQSSEDVSS